jgi:hypothetical protein
VSPLSSGSAPPTKARPATLVHEAENSESAFRRGRRTGPSIGVRLADFSEKVIGFDGLRVISVIHPRSGHRPPVLFSLMCSKNQYTCDRLHQSERAG